MSAPTGFALDILASIRSGKCCLQGDLLELCTWVTLTEVLQRVDSSIHGFSVRVLALLRSAFLRQGPASLGNARKERRWLGAL